MADVIQDAGVPGLSRADTLVVHANWSTRRLHLWCESSGAFGGALGDAGDEGHGVERAHPFAADAGDVAAALGLPGSSRSAITLRLPTVDDRPIPSAALTHWVGRPDVHADVAFASYAVPTVEVGPEDAERLLESLIERVEADGADTLKIGSTVEFFAVAARLARHLLARQRFVPMVLQAGDGGLTASWRPWLADEESASRTAVLLRAMPPAARAVDDDLGHDPAKVLESYLGELVDAACRAVLDREEMTDTIEDIDPAGDPQVAWLTGLLDGTDEVPAQSSIRTDFVRRVRRWIGGLEDRGESSTWRLGLRLNEPLAEALEDQREGDLATDDDADWSVSFFLQSQANPDIAVDGSDVWLLSRETVVVEGLTLESPQELLLAELGRASRYYKRLEDALDEAEPIEVMLDTKQAYEFLREVRPVLLEQGFAVESPAWWDSPTGRLGARLRIGSDPLEALLEAGGAGSTASPAQLGLGALVGYHWEIAIGDTTLTLHEFEQFAQKSSPLVRIGGKWVEIRPEDVQNAIRFIRENPGGQMELSEAMRLAYASDPKKTGVPVLGMEASGWVAEVFGAGGESAAISLPALETPESFHGTLRPYQNRGLSWLAFMEQFGFGACLADDMGLGKTIQVLALLAHEREDAARARRAGETDPAKTSVAPTLLIVPMSVVGNWTREIRRFTPSLRTVVHHGVERAMGDAFVDEVGDADIVITTYALANRDKELLQRVDWGRVVLDEAQFIKNPAAKQSQAVRSLEVERRVALTGTPVENRLSELWSIMDFLNPAYLGGSGVFRKRFSVPIERYRDQNKMAQLRGLVRPFILRRVKTDPTVVADLPEKIEGKELCHLTSEQAALYENCVKRMLSDVEASDGIHRRGLVLAGLIRLKQICNHPSQMLKDHDFASGQPVDPARSGKCVRLLEMLDEALAEGDQALVFTQFRQMGHLLAAMLRHELNRDVLFLHGGTPQGQRQKLIDRFQDEGARNPILILSLKAGGVGLNLTAATHVFHFDRWWNPAVENQATDRAYRIGQTRTVQVHKYVVRGTLEERIDEMIESKTELAENIIGAGERWLTELDTSQLRSLLALRADAIGDEE